MNDVEMVAGVEVHAQLITDSKLFCPCPARFGSAPNTHICPVCTGQPGVLPVLNHRAWVLGIRAAAALDCELPPLSAFDRKNYFYPDLPKGYQITQRERPLGRNGRFSFLCEGESKTVSLTTVHIEEDAGKTIHGFEEGGDLLDYNRAGIPLLEIVTAPDFRSPAEVGAYLRELRQFLEYAGVSDGNMEEGSFRCEPNVSVRRHGDTRLGSRTEIKNLNSIRAVERAVAYEVERQTSALLAGKPPAPETRLWDRTGRETRRLRSKEDFPDYRYFPEPDLPVFAISPREVKAARHSLPELPRARRRRFQEELGLAPDDAALLTSRLGLADFFEACLGEGAPVSRLTDVFRVDLLSFTRAQDLSDPPFPPGDLAVLLSLEAQGRISRHHTRSILEIMVDRGGAPEDIAEKMSFCLEHDPRALLKSVESVLKAHPASVADARQGRVERAVGFLMGRIMAATSGKADPHEAKRLLREILGAEGEDSASGR